MANATKTVWLTNAEAAEVLGIKATTLATWRYLQKGPRYYKAGSTRIRYKASDVEQWIEESAVEH